MGNDQSHMSGLEVTPKAVEINDFWSQHTATLNAGTTVSVFIGEPSVGGLLWVSQTPLEKASKNLMIHRHPCILKYISSWSKGAKFYLAVEEVRPLTHEIGRQSVLQMCIGLHAVLKALVFLHEKASSSHNNVCTAAIYITKEGGWRLGGVEYLSKFDEMNVEFMSKTRTHRYGRAVDPNEDTNLLEPGGAYSVDAYAYAVLVQDVFKKINDDAIPSLKAFLEICKNDLQNPSVSKRPKLSTLLNHQFFNHEFINVHSFLIELPLKADNEKTEFFVNLMEKLRRFEELSVATQLGGLLLCRMVLLNKTAQNEVLPYVLSVKDGERAKPNSIFTASTFKQFMAPRILEIFCVRDAQVRLLLLENFANYMETFTKEQLQSQILPELLVGIKDTNDNLVSVTLRSLADLVPVLGASTVIGGKRARLFNDGRPMTHKPRSRRTSRRSHEIVAPHNVLESDVSSSTSNTEPTLELPERPSPDGEEDETSTEEVEVTVGDEEEEVPEDEQDENWDDWEINEDGTSSVLPAYETSTIYDTAEIEINVDRLQIHPFKPANIPDIHELDIKNQKNANEHDEMDFFQDMEPVIERPKKFLVNPEPFNKYKLDLGVNDTDRHEEGWGDDLDWD